MRKIELADAENGLSDLITEIEATGEGVLVTRHGKPVVRLVRASCRPSQADRAALGRYLIERLDALAWSHPTSAQPVDWPTLKGLMNEGRN